MTRNDSANELGLPAGKVPPDVLRRLLAIPRCTCPQLVVPPALGEDGAVLRLAGGLLVVGSDPITFPTRRPGHFAVCVNANDIAVMGARPEYFTMTVMAPSGTLEESIVEIVSDAVETADAIGVVLIGGNTEVTNAVNRPVVSVTMFGGVVGERPLLTGGGEQGDILVQVNPLALEGTAILAAEYHESLLERLPAKEVVRAAEFAINPGICIVEPALAISEMAGVHALHDPTEGGIVTGIREMAVASGLGVRVRQRDLIVLDITRAIAAQVGIDPLGLISSGCLICAVSPDAALGVITVLRRAGYEARAVGEFIEGGKFVLVDGNGEDQELPCFRVDELAK